MIARATVVTFVAVVGLAGCAGGGSGQKFVAQDASSCKAQQKQIAQLVAKGVPGKIEAMQNGRKVSAEARAQVETYNELLESYMGSGCHKV